MFFILMFQNDTMQVVWQYHVEEPVSAAGVLPPHGAVRGSRPLYLVQRDSQPKRAMRNHEVPPTLKTWNVLNQQVSERNVQDSKVKTGIIFIYVVDFFP